jgi:nucleotide-binding universal stress UspA family protein
MKTIVIATDGSPGAWAAVQEGLALATEVGADAAFVTVRHDAPLLGDPWYQRHLTAQLGHAREALERAEAEAKRLGVPCDSEILEGDPATCIAEAAEARNADLVVVGSRGHGALTSALIGSVSREVMTRSPAPVMIVREPAHDRTLA